MIPRTENIAENKGRRGLTTAKEHCGTPLPRPLPQLRWGEEYLIHVPPFETVMTQSLMGGDKGEGVRVILFLMPFKTPVKFSNISRSQNWSTL